MVKIEVCTMVNIWSILNVKILIKYRYRMQGQNQGQIKGQDSWSKSGTNIGEN
jgi:hypothetical protein